MVIVGIMRHLLGVPVIRMRRMGMMAVDLRGRARLMVRYCRFNVQVGMMITMVGVPDRALSGGGSGINQ